MKIDLEDFHTGWFGVHVGLTSSEIQLLISRLQTLQQKRGHFHLRRSDFAGSGGVADVEFYWADDDTPKNMQIE